MSLGKFWHEWTCNTCTKTGRVRRSKGRSQARRQHSERCPGMLTFIKRRRA